MDSKQHTKKVGFCCPQHGVLTEKVEYFSVNLGSKKMVDVSVMRCPECKKYFTPFTNLLAIAKIRYRGQQVFASLPVARKSIARVEVCIPQIIDIEEYERRNEQLKLEQAEKHRQYIESLRVIAHDEIILTNKLCFIKENRCPECNNITRKEYVKIQQRWKYVLANVRCCSRCGFEYITPSQFYDICEKAKKVIRGNYRRPFISPINIQYELNDASEALYIPKSALDYEIYDHHHLPPQHSGFYDMTDEEYLWVKMYYQPEEFQVHLRLKSFLGEAGYSTSESEIRRRAILDHCVQEYGKWKVINQLKSNMNTKLMQKDGEIRYSKALNIWRSDIFYVENNL